MNPSGETAVLNPQSTEKPSNDSEAADNNAANYAAQDDFEPNTSGYNRSSYSHNPLMPQYSPYYQYPNTYFDPYIETAPFYTTFPRAKDYSNPESIAQAFPHLKDINCPEFDIESISPDAHFYILRSSNDDNIHKAIKYQVWTSTSAGKTALKKACQEFHESNKKPEIYLLFSVVSSNQFLGVAKMTTELDDNESFKYWWEPCKWFGSFKVQWLFIKDIHYSKFEQVQEESVGIQVINLKDGDKISAKAGKEMLSIFKQAPSKPNIFDFFAFMDRREDFIRMQRDDNPEFEAFYQECCEAYVKNPDMIFQSRRSFYPKRSYKKNNYYAPKKSQGSSRGNGNGAHVSEKGNGVRKSLKVESQSFTLEEQFVVRTEADKANKKNKLNKKNKKQQNDDKVNPEFFEKGKEYLKANGKNHSSEEDN